MSALKTLIVGSELYPLILPGGLADVTGALPGALAKEGIQTRALIPGYPVDPGQIRSAHRVCTNPDFFGDEGAHDLNVHR